jgi:hypothetical protein
MPIVRSQIWTRACLTLVCVAILVTRLSGAHLHLCFDGSEPPESVQLTAVASDESPDEARKPRHDLDVNLIGEALAKKLDSSLELPMLLAAAIVLFRVQAVGAPVIARHRAVPLIPIPAFRLRPPLRAPPR